MNIVHLSKLSCGGATRYAQMLDDGLRDAGLDSRLVTDQTLQKLGLRDGRRRFANRVTNRLLVEIQRDVFHRVDSWPEFSLVDVVKDADIVHVHQVTDWIGLSQLIREVPGTAGLVISLHDLWPITGGCVVFNGCEQFRDACAKCPILKPPFDRLIARWQLATRSRSYRSRPMTFIANSDWTRERMLEARALQGLSPPLVIHPAIETDLFRPSSDEERKAARTQFGIPQDGLVVLAGCSSLTDVNKNLAATVRVVGQVALQLAARVTLVLFGDGRIPVPEGLNVVFAGSIPERARLAELYRVADVFVSTSRMETYGMTLLEAMASRVPVVAYRTGAIPNVLDEGRAGLLAPLDDERAVANAVLELFQSESRHREVVDAGLLLVRSRNSPEELLRSHRDVYARVLQHAV